MHSPKPDQLFAPWHAGTWLHSVNMKYSHSMQPVLLYHHSQDTTADTATILQAGLSGVCTLSTATEFDLFSRYPHWLWSPRSHLLHGFWAKRLGHYVDHEPSPSTEDKNTYSYASTLSICLHGMVRTTLPSYMFTPLLPCIKLSLWLITYHNTKRRESGCTVTCILNLSTKQ